MENRLSSAAAGIDAISRSGCAENENDQSTRDTVWRQHFVKGSHGTGQAFPDREDKFIMEACELPILLSGDKAANPVEHLLHALVSCMTDVTPIIGPGIMRVGGCGHAAALC